MTRPPRLVVTGTATMRSPLFSNWWELVDGDGYPLARLQRHPRLHVSTIEIEDGSTWLLEPAGNGVVIAMHEGTNEIGRIVRRSWWGRRWQVSGPAWGYEVVSDRVPRRWHFAVGGEPVAVITGSVLSYNTVTVDAVLPIQVCAVVLAWHVIARPWEQAAAPRGLVPIRQRGTSTRPATGAA